MAKTVNQLEAVLGSYVEPNGDFATALSQVLPRLYNLGFWRDLVFELSLPGTRGYISLPADAESVISCTVDGNPRMVRSMWHDVRITGRQPELSPLFGIVDDGMYPVAVDVTDADDTIDGSVPVTIYAAPEGNNRGNWEAEENAVIWIKVDKTGDTGFQVVTLEFNGGEWAATPVVGFTKVLEISYSDLPQNVDIYVGDDATEPIATLPAGSGVARFRRFRISESGDDTVVHLLCKRAAPCDLTPDTVIYLSNFNALKHGLLARLSEDNADVERAEYHWQTCAKLLDEELDAFRGSARPALQLNLWGGNRPLNML
jgi:hypothetical protein